MDSTPREESMKLVHVHFKNIKNFFSDASGPPIDLVVVLEHWFSFSDGMTQAWGLGEGSELRGCWRGARFLPLSRERG